MGKMEYYQVSLAKGFKWEEDFEAFVETDIDYDKDVICCSDVNDAIRVFAERIPEIGDEEELSIIQWEAETENPPERDYVLNWRDFTEQFHCMDADEYDPFEIATLAIHDQVSYSHLDDLLGEAVRDKCRYFNMRVICEEASVSYSTFRGFKNNRQPISDEKLLAILRTMSRVGSKCWSDDMDKYYEKITGF